MTDALLVSDQHMDQSFLPTSGSTGCAGYEWLSSNEQTSGGESARGSEGSLWPSTPSGSPFFMEHAASKTREESSPIVAQRALEQLAALRRDQQTYEKARNEMEWVVENRARFKGRWIALSGRDLLAAGNSAMEVFRETEHMVPPPLVIKIEDDSLPFSGW